MGTGRSSTVWQGFQSLCGEIGRTNAVLYAVQRLLFIVLKGKVRFHKYYFVAQPVSHEPMLPPGRGKKIHVRMVDSQDSVTYKFPRPRDAIEARFRQGAKCMAAFKDDQFVGYLWLISGTYQEDEVRANFSPLPGGQAIWDFDVYVDPAHRVGFTFARLWDEANRYLVQNGVKWSCSRISAFNASSLGAHARLGTKTLGTALFICSGEWQAAFSTVAPFFHLSTRPDSSPSFHFDASQERSRQPTKANPE